MLVSNVVYYSSFNYEKREKTMVSNMRALLCQCCGGALSFNEEKGIYTCKYCGTEQIPCLCEKKNVLYSSNNRKAQQLLVAYSNHGNEADSLFEYCRLVLDNALTCVLEKKTVTAIESYFDIIENVQKLLIEANLFSRMEGLKTLSLNKLYAGFSDEMELLAGRKLEWDEFTKLRLMVGASQLITDKVLSLDTESDTKKSFVKITILSIEELVANNSKELVGDKWGAFNYIPRLNQTEIECFNNSQ